MYPNLTPQTPHPPCISANPQLPWLDAFTEAGADSYPSMRGVGSHNSQDPRSAVLRNVSTEVPR